MFDLFLKFLNDNLGFVTLIAAASAFVVYWKQKEDQKRNAARIALQEIRRAEDIIFDYREHGQYKFTKKIIATNSWANNIHHFVGDLNVDELDRISNLYSTGEYLDSIITKISDFNFDKKIKEFENELKIALQSVQVPSQPNILQQQGTPQIQQTGNGQFMPQNITFKLPITLPAPWKDLLDEITLKYEPIYHSTIVEKLKRIAKLK